MPRYIFAEADANVKSVATSFHYLSWGDTVLDILDVDVAAPMTLAANAIVGNISRGKYRAVMLLYSGTYQTRRIYPQQRKHVIQLRFNEQPIGYVYEVGQADLGTLTPTVFTPMR